MSWNYDLIGIVDLPVPCLIHTALQVRAKG